MIGILGAATSAMGAVAKYSSDSQATAEYNAQAAAAHRDADIAATNKYKDLSTKYVYDAKSLNNDAYKATLKGRAELATGVASAGAVGIAPGSLTLNNLVAATRQQMANNESNISDKRDDNKETLVGADASVQAEAQQRINSMPFKAGPNPMTAALGVASAVVGGFQSVGNASPGGLGNSMPGINLGI